MKTKLIKIDNYWIVVEDKRIENPKTTDIILDEYNEVGNFVDLSHLGLGYGNFKKVIASQNPDHNLPNITFSEEVAKELGEVDVEQKALEAIPMGDEGTYFDRLEWIKGYNQCKEDNKEKKYTEEQVREAMHNAKLKLPSGNSAYSYQTDYGGEFKLTPDEIINSLNKQEYEVEIQCSKNGIKKEGESCTLNNKCIYPKCLITNNSITITKIIK